jgi:hypothetical protein
MEQTSWEVDSRSFGQETSRLSRNQKIHYSVHKNRPLVPILSQMNPVHTLAPYFNINIIHVLVGIPSDFFPSGLKAEIMYAL